MNKVLDRRGQAGAKATAASIPVAEIAAAAEESIRRVAPSLRRVIKYGAPTYQGRGDVCTIGRWKQFVAVGFWAGAPLARRHAILEGSAPSTRVVKLRTVAQASSREFLELIRDAARLDLEAPVHPA